MSGEFCKRLSQKLSEAREELEKSKYAVTEKPVKEEVIERQAPF
jgi:hypothetical protein